MDAHRSQPRTTNCQQCQEAIYADGACYDAERSICGVSVQKSVIVSCLILLLIVIVVVR